MTNLSNHDVDSPARMNDPGINLQVLMKKHDYYSFKEKETKWSYLFI